MLEKIPGFNATPNSSSPTAAADLIAVTFYPSHFLYRAQLTAYLVMLIFSGIALLPFLVTDWSWIAIWLVFAGATGMAISSARGRKNASPKTLHITQQQWRLTTCAGEFSVKHSGELLLWSWLIIIPVRELLSGRAHYLIALPDSLDKEEWRRLRVWLNLHFTRV